LDAGVPIQELRSKTHDIDVDRQGASRATVRLRDEAVIPNKDFILKYDVAGAEIADAVLTTPAPGRAKPAGGYFTMILQPPARLPESDIQPKELVFVLDTSGSMMGFPIEQAKQVINRALDELYPGDAFNLITFSGDTYILFPEPVYPTVENIRKAKALLASRSGAGGTEMMKAIRAALAPSDRQDHVRVVCFITDGYVGNDMEIVGEVQKHPNARVFAFGVGSSVNRFLLDKMADAGRGAVEYVSLADKASEAADRFYERVRSPLLTDLSLDWGTLPVEDVYPQRLPDLFSGRPLVITGRYTQSGRGAVQLKGTRAGGSFRREIPVEFMSSAPAADALASFWAHRRIDHLMSQDWLGMQQGNMKPALQEQITQLGLDYRLMTQFTSFVAVEERIVTKDGQSQRLEVPVEMPQGVSYEGVFGDRETVTVNASTAQVSSSSVAGLIGGFFRGARSKAAPPTPLPPPATAQTIAVPGKVIPRSEETRDRVRSVPASDPKRGLLESKLQPAVLAAVDCMHTSASRVTSCAHVHAGKITLEVWFTQDSESLRKQLQVLGFELKAEHRAQKMLVGDLAVDKLADLVKIAAMQFVSLERR